MVECAAVIIPSRSFSSGRATALHNPCGDRCRSPRCMLRAYPYGPGAAACATCGAGHTPRRGHVVPHGRVMAVGHEAPSSVSRIVCGRRVAMSMTHEDVYQKYVRSTCVRGEKTCTNAIQTQTNMDTHHHSSHQTNPSSLRSSARGPPRASASESASPSRRAQGLLGSLVRPQTLRRAGLLEQAFRRSTSGLHVAATASALCRL